MPLAPTHIGWENEHLATYLLSRMAFVASPIKIGDDVGTDLFCTMFERVETEKARLLVPRNSIAVQVKSSGSSVSLSPSQLEYLARLEIPYYIGIIDQTALSLTMYSARYLPLLLTLKGHHPNGLRLDLVQSLDGRYREGDEASGFVLRCPQVAVLSAQDDPEVIQEKSATIQTDAVAGLKAIATRLNTEYIYETPDGVEIFAGRDSATTFRENFMRRLAEALYNFLWLLEDGQSVSRDEIDIYLHMHDKLLDQGDVPAYLDSAHSKLVEKLDAPV